MSDEIRKDRNERVIHTGEQPVARVARPEPDSEEPEGTDANPPRTTTGRVTSPRFGSAGSGGGEFEGPSGKN